MYGSSQYQLMDTSPARLDSETETLTLLYRDQLLLKHAIVNRGS